MNDPFEGVRRLEAVLEHGPDVPQLLRARALRVYAESAYIAGDYDTSDRMQKESLREFRELGDEPGIAIALHRNAVGEIMAGDLVRARERLDECLAICQRRPNRKLVADTIVKLGSVEWREGNPDRALELWQEGAARCEEIGFTWMQAIAVQAIADIAYEVGRTELARQRAPEALRLCRECDDRQLTVYALSLLARLAAEAGNVNRAGRLWGAIETEESRGPFGHWESERDREFASIADASSPEFEQGRSAGRSLTVDEAVEYALAETD
jgi:ATP/maltotriose-dependent transcriptional regulator MalT